MPRELLEAPGSLTRPALLEYSRVMAKLWEKGYSLDDAVECFTVGRDYLLDLNLITADAVASIAHVRMLASTGLLENDQARALEEELRQIARDGVAGKVRISREDEDCHTVLEALLTERLGDAGKRVHTGRSRNDQVTVATRLFSRESLLTITTDTITLVERLLDRAREESSTVMPGRTHLQIAMLSTFGLWLASWAEQLLDDLELLETAARLNDRSPLGSAASYGVPLPLDREMVADVLGFSGVQNNVLAVQHSRGTLDGHIAGALAAIATTLGRMAQDLILFSLPEVGYVRLPSALCSGSSIMPQKQNPDALELLRSRASLVEGWAAQCRGVVRGLPSGYNRDLQDTKEPLLRSLATVREELAVALVLVDRLEPQRDRMAKALNAEVFATDYAYQLVLEGVPFREAYQRAARDYGQQELPDPREALARRTSTGTPGNLNLEAPLRRLAGHKERVLEGFKRHQRALKDLLGQELSLLPQDESR
ncbi:argininosuccinate lyase [Alkalispirochaeta americana]|uniref:Argininosuccinate lyase n=1 Tax=Alkalispirochaeta americana TaxID=159291 RepID=A0A1N6PR58_9SPIO|nr:argininosuccinate lyase [Alkalispirochaeta americana]SIQ06850.1 argininosuccinate lyase [Alkalispirochaeta americana]